MTDVVAQSIADQNEMIHTLDWRVIQRALRDQAAEIKSLRASEAALREALEELLLHFSYGPRGSPQEKERIAVEQRARAALQKATSK